MSVPALPHKFGFRIECSEPRLGIPDRLVVGRKAEESQRDVVLKLLGYLYFHRERLQLGGHLQAENIPFVPDLLQLDYEGRPRFWGECGESDPRRIRKILQKASRAEVWWIRCAGGEPEEDLRRAGVRPGRLRFLDLPGEPLDELSRGLRARNEVFWMPPEHSPPLIQLDFNGLWIESGFRLGGY